MESVSPPPATSTALDWKNDPEAFIHRALAVMRPHRTGSFEAYRPLVASALELTNQGSPLKMQKPFSVTVAYLLLRFPESALINPEDTTRIKEIDNRKERNETLEVARWEAMLNFLDVVQGAPDLLRGRMDQTEETMGLIEKAFRRHFTWCDDANGMDKRGGDSNSLQSTTSVVKTIIQKQLSVAKSRMMTQQQNTMTLAQVKAAAGREGEIHREQRLMPNLSIHMFAHLLDALNEDLLAADPPMRDIFVKDWRDTAILPLWSCPTFVEDAILEPLLQGEQRGDEEAAILDNAQDATAFWDKKLRKALIQLTALSFATTSDHLRLDSPITSGLRSFTFWSWSRLAHDLSVERFRVSRRCDFDVSVPIRNVEHNAVAAFIETVRHEPTNSSIWNNFSCVLMDKEKVRLPLYLFDKDVNSIASSKEEIEFDAALSEYYKSCRDADIPVQSVYTRTSDIDDLPEKLKILLREPRDARVVKAECFAKVVELSPNGKLGWRNIVATTKRGDSVQLFGETKSRVEILALALQRFPQEYNFWFQLGYTLGEIKDADPSTMLPPTLVNGIQYDVVAACQKSVELKPSNSWAWNNLGYYMVLVNRDFALVDGFPRLTATECVLESLRLRKGNSSVWDSLGFALKNGFTAEGKRQEHTATFDGRVWTSRECLVHAAETGSPSSLKKLADGITEAEEAAGFTITVAGDPLTKEQLMDRWKIETEKKKKKDEGDED